MAERTNIIRSTAEYTRSYENMRGVDLSGTRSSGRFGYLKNMYVDYEGGGGAVESIPGFRRLCSLGERIYAIYSQNVGEGEKYVIVHAGGRLYRFNTEERDALGTLSPIAEIASRRSSAFTFGKNTYVIDGEQIVCISQSGEVTSTADGTLRVYVPTLFADGAPCEERNLLTDSFIERYTVKNTDSLAYGTKALVYEVTDSDNKFCAVTGISSSHEGAVYIPQHTVIGGERYKVTAIADAALRLNSKITALITPKGLESIGQYALSDCAALSLVVISDTVKTVGARAFCRCGSLKTVYLGIGVKLVSPEIFHSVSGITVNYAGTADDLTSVDGYSALTAQSVVYSARYGGIKLALPVISAVREIGRVTVGGEDCAFSYSPADSAILIDLEDRYSKEGMTAEIYGTLEGGSDTSAILGSRVSAIFDGRIFLSGNADFPGTVFYSSDASADTTRGLYFAAGDRFTDGVGNYGVVSMLAANGELTVFKSGDDGAGCIFCHTAHREGGRAVYPVSYVHGGLSPFGASYLFYDDAVFLSDTGISALQKTSGSEFREAVTRSSNISPVFADMDKSEASFTEWRGYLVLTAGDRMYLGDSRGRFRIGTSFEYEWYPLEDIGSYYGDTRLYRYGTAKVGLALSERPDEPVTDTVTSFKSADGSTLYYTYEGLKIVSVYPTEELVGGIFSPATCAAGIGELLFFGTASGDICLFNNDKRGVAPERISSCEDFDAEEYAARLGGRIHPDFYTFAGHACVCAAETPSDDCDIPYLTKCTADSSLVIKLKSYPHSVAHVEVSTDSGGLTEFGKLPAASISFDDLDFSALALSPADSTLYTVPEELHGWCEKKLCIGSDAFRSPIGIYSASYRYKIKGRIKNT